MAKNWSDYYVELVPLVNENCFCPITFAKGTFIIQHDRRRFTTFPSTPRDHTLHATPSHPVLLPSLLPLVLPPFFIFITSHPFRRAHDEPKKASSISLETPTLIKLRNNCHSITDLQSTNPTSYYPRTGGCRSARKLGNRKSVSQGLRWILVSEWVIVKNKGSMDETIFVGRSLKKRSLSRNLTWFFKRFSNVMCFY